MSSPEHPPAPPPDSVTATAPANAPADAPADGSPTGIQAAPAAPPGPIPLPPPAPRPAPAPPDPARLARRVGFLDDVLVLFVLVFAFLLASFLATNSDLFLHLASGRLLARGEYEWGKDPFTFTASAYWANHAWLFDLLAYGTYQIPSVGPTLLVVLKALLVALLSALMLGTSHRPGGRWWLPAVCVALAVLVMAPRLLVQPVVVSYLLLGVTLWLLVGGRRRAEEGAPPGWRWWLLPGVCLLWVNVDSWFLLGPVAVALFLAGELIQWRLDPEPSAGGRLGTLAVVLGLSVGACLVNPHHVRAFTLPSALGLGRAAEVLREDPQFRMFSVAPWQGVYFQPGVGLNVPGLAYFLLLGLGVLSFVLLVPGLFVSARQAGRWRWWRLLVWLPLALLGGMHALSIPFFAVVGGPITALNLADFASGWLGDELRLGPGGRRWAVGGRLLTLLALAVLLVATLPGWVQGLPYGPYDRWRVAWGVSPDVSLRDAALRIKSWREEGRIEPGQHWFNTSPEVVNYLAWYCPGERGALDYRLELFGEVAPDWLKVRKALAGQSGEREQTATLPDGSLRAVGAWEPVFRRRAVRFLFFHAYDLPRLASTATRLYADDREWKPCFLEGQTAVLGWVDPDKPDEAREFKGLAIDFEVRAFGPDAEKAPERPAAPPRARRWWEALWAAGPPRSVDDGTAFQYEARFSGLMGRYRLDQELTLLGRSAGALVGSAGGSGGPVVNGTLAPLRISHTYTQIQRGAFQRGEAQPTPWDRQVGMRMQAYLEAQDAGPPSALYLAVRAARRAFAAGSEEPRTGVVLAQAYLWLHRRTREFSRTGGGTGFPHVRLIRQTQAAYALNRALRLAPPPEIAAVSHFMLADEVYAEPEYFELRVKHLKEYLRLSRSMKLFPGLPREDFPRQLEGLEKQLQKLERDLRGRQDQYEVMSANKRVLEKARIAVRQGLAETALNLLLQADAENELADPGNKRLRSGATLEIYLLLGTGRLEEAAEALKGDPQGERSVDKDLFGVHPVDQDPRWRRVPGARAYEFFQVQLAAGLGDYAAADKYLAELYDQVARTPLVYALLEQIDVLPAGRGAGKGADVGLLAGAGLGHLLLGESSALTGGVPGHILGRLFPYRLQAPLPRRPGWQVDLALVRQFSLSLLEQQADLLTLRGWLALEAGDTKAARQHLQKALDLATFSAGGGRPTQGAVLRSQGLALVCLDLLRSGERKK